LTATDPNPWLAREKPELVALMSLPGITPRRMRDMLAVFGSPAGAWNAVLNRATGEPEEVARDWRQRATASSPDAMMSRFAASDITVIVRGEPVYPAMLGQIHDPPFVLFVRGALPLGRDCVGIVGARKASAYGVEATRSLAEGLAAAGLCVVSGAAYGIDTAAHDGAIKARGLTTAVLGCGVDVVYPRSNAKLYEDIRHSGALVSEYFPGTEPKPYQFPARNRIIAGLSRAVVVVEASERSGALITADFALAEGRDVMAVPGQVFSPNSKGTHGLIRAGAALVTNAEDVLVELGLSGEHAPWDQQQSPGHSPEEEALLQVLAAGPVDMEALCLATGQPVASATANLSSLEVRGLVTRMAGNRYQRCRPR
jgi:DNA processing protein